jgi:hypothetical protein
MPKLGPALCFGRVKKRDGLQSASRHMSRRGR